MVSFENFVKSMPPSLSELKITPSFCFPNMIPHDPTASIRYIINPIPCCSPRLSMLHDILYKGDKIVYLPVEIAGSLKGQYGSA